MEPMTSVQNTKYVRKMLAYNKPSFGYMMTTSFIYAGAILFLVSFISPAFAGTTDKEMTKSIAYLVALTAGFILFFAAKLVYGIVKYLRK